LRTNGSFLLEGPKALPGKRSPRDFKIKRLYRMRLWVGLIPGSDHPSLKTIFRAHFRRQLKEMPWVTNPTRS
jgi:hypothetical protein